MRVENFLSFGEADFDFDNTGFVLVEGDNGSGKSAIVDAILWCLFGETLRGYKYDDVVNRRVGEGCLVRLHLADGDELYTITRARRHPKLKNALIVTHDNFGKDMTAGGEKETQLVIEHLLGCSFKTFVSSVIFGQDRAYRFSSLTDAEQKKILDEVLGVERFADACAAARKQVSATQAELEAAARELGRAEDARDEAEAEAVDLQVKDTDFAASQQRKIEEEREKLRAVKEQLNKTRKFADVAALKSVVSEAAKTLAEQEKRVDKEASMDAEARVAVAGSKAKLDDAEEALRKHQKLPSRCSMCGQQVTAKAGASVVVAARLLIDKLKKEHASWTEISDEATATLVTCRSKLREARQAVIDAQKALGDGAAREAEAASWRRRRVDHEARIAELEAEVSPYAALAEKARARHGRHEKDAARLSETVGELEERIARSQFWVKAFGNSGLRSLLIDSSLPLLNEEAARVSRVLTGGAISIEFSATSEQKSGKVVDRFEVRVDNKHGAGDYAGNSAGERAKVDLCVGLALQRLVASRSSASFNLAVFDEVFDHLDSASHEPVIEVLSELDKESVLVVSHDDDLKAWFPATWRMVKRGGFSAVDS